MKTKSLVLAAFAVAIVAPANAQNLQYTGAELSGIKSATISVNGGANKNVLAGRLKFSDGASTILTYCIDAERTLNGGTHGYTSNTLNTNAANGLAYAGRIVGNAFNLATTTEQQAGLQRAIWSAVYDAGTSFTANGANFSVSNVNQNVLNWANTYYAGKDNPLPATIQVKTFITQANGGQSQITTEVVPEPASMIALGAGLAMIARRRKSK
jgi:hypothetical protein